MELNAWLCWILLMVGALHLGLVAFVWRHRHVPGGMPFMLVMVAGGGWAISFGLPLGQPDPNLAMLVSQARFAVLAFMGPALFLMLLEHSRQETVRDWRLLAVLLAIPAVTIVLSVTMPWHELMRYDFHPVAKGEVVGVGYREGPWYQVHMLYTNLLIIFGVGMALSSMRGRGLIYRRQMRTLALAPLLPLVLNIAFTAGLWPAPVLNLAPFSLLFSGTLMALALFRYRAFDLRPQAVSAAVAQMQDAFILTDARGRLLDLNGAAELMLGMPEGQAVGQELDVLFGGWPEARALTAREDEAFQDEIACCPEVPEGVAFYDVRVAPVKAGDGLVVGRVYLFRDITDRKHMEERLALSLVRERELHQLKSTFVSLVSHEFRTPLATLQGAADLLGEHFGSAAPAIRQRSLDAIRNQVRRLSVLLDQATAMNRLEEGQVPFSPQPVAATGLIRNWCAVEALTAGRPGDVRVEAGSMPDGKVELDPFLCECMVSNLVANALKYSPPGSLVRVLLRHDGRRLSVAVTDRGIGIPDGLLPVLFQPFHRGANVGRVKGTGVGLFLVRRCAELHRGSVKVSQGEGGTCFTLVLPVPSVEASS
jgi:PAS domain S-box-containing protein